VENVSEYRVNMGLTKDGKTLIYKRRFFFGGGDHILFPSGTYPALKQIFDAVHTADNHTISLKMAEAPAK